MLGGTGSIEVIDRGAPGQHQIVVSELVAILQMDCSTCDLDNDLLDSERYHLPREIYELCVKGEDEAVFYNCSLHDPRLQEGNYWVESVERYNVFGD